MSVVAVKITKREIELASDSFIGGMYSQSKIEFVKSFKVNKMTVGGVGDATEISLLKVFCESHMPKRASEDFIIDFFVEFFDWLKKKSSDFKPSNSWIFIYGGKAFYVHGLYVRQIKDTWAIGAGMYHAQGVLYLGHSAKEAVQAACELSPWCEKPINIFKIKL